MNNDTEAVEIYLVEVKDIIRYTRVRRYYNINVCSNFLFFLFHVAIISMQTRLKCP